MDEAALITPAVENTLPASAVPRERPLPLTLQDDDACPRSATGQDLALAGIAHDARNLVTALRLCADLIAEPGVLVPEHAYLGDQVHALAEASGYIYRRLSSVARTATLASEVTSDEVSVENLPAAVRQLTSLLSAIAGPAVTLEVETHPCPGRLDLTEESLTRILLNLVRNAADAMASGRIHISVRAERRRNFLRELAAGPAQPRQWISATIRQEPEQGTAPSAVLITVEDDGPGIPPALVGRIFDPGFSTRGAGRPWPEAQHHGLGLSIVRDLVQAAGGTIRALNRPSRGARFEVRFPVTDPITDVMPTLLPEGVLSAQNEA